MMRPETTCSNASRRASHTPGPFWPAEKTMRNRWKPWHPDLMTRYSRITGTGSYLPPRRVTNADLAAELAAKGVETSDQWSVERTGIRARHFAAPEVSTSDLGVQAARQALEAAGVRAEEIDLIIVATSTPDMIFPSAAS